MNIIYVSLSSAYEALMKSKPYTDFRSFRALFLLGLKDKQQYTAMQVWGCNYAYVWGCHDVHVCGDAMMRMCGGAMMRMCGGCWGCHTAMMSMRLCGGAMMSPGGKRPPKFLHVHALRM